MADMTWEDLDNMVEGDPLTLRDTAWAEIVRLRKHAARMELHRDKCAKWAGVDISELEAHYP